MNIKHNQKFQGTEKKIKDALWNLMETCSFEELTVQSICKKANINRSTFYAHYLDLADLMETIEGELTKSLLQRFQKPLSMQDNIFSSAYLTVFLKHIKEHQQYYAIILQNQRKFPLKMGYDFLWNFIAKPLFQENGIIEEEEKTYYFIYFQAGVTMMMKHWVETGCQTAVERMAKIISQCLPDLKLGALEQKEYI